MIYEAINQPKKLETDLLDRAVLFACKYLKIDLDLVIEFETLSKGQYGFCDFDEDETIITLAKRLSVKDAIRTLFHELVHVKQHVDGRLERGYIWCGRVYECDYTELPWEIEAYDLEEKMMEQFYGSH
jgi:hypothetical protein